MNNVIKIGLLTSLIFTTVIAIGLFGGGGISITPNVYDVFAEKDKEVKNSNFDGSTTTTISLKNSSEKCSPLDPRC